MDPEKLLRRHPDTPPAGQITVSGDSRIRFETTNGGLGVQVTLKLSRGEIDQLREVLDVLRAGQWLDVYGDIPKPIEITKKELP